MSTVNVICKSCGRFFTSPAHQSINASTQPEMKERILNGELFLWECPECGARQLLKYPLVYVDPSQHLIICLSDVPMSIEDLGGNTGRLVGEVGELIEKIKIFDAGLDDVAVEMCKFVTLQEMRRDVPLKFLSFEGADNSLVFTYPENGEMQLLSVGFNVYEDCLGILQRNPAIRGESQKSLMKVDQKFISTTIG